MLEKISLCKSFEFKFRLSLAVTLKDIHIVHLVSRHNSNVVSPVVCVNPEFV